MSIFRRLFEKEISETRSFRVDREGEDRVGCAELSSDGGLALVGLLDEVGVRVWDVGNGEEIHRFGDVIGYVSNLAFSSDGRHALTVSDDSFEETAEAEMAVRLWDLESGVEVLHFSNEREPLDVAYAPETTKRLSSVNMCSVRHRPMPSAPNSRAFWASSGISAFARTPRVRSSSAQARICSKSSESSG